MVLDITQYGNSVLRQKCKPVEQVTDEIRNLADDMVETMNHADGVGIAAPQVGKTLRMAVVDVSHDPESFTVFKVDGKTADFKDYMPLVFINPELELFGEKVSDTEGCLSIQEIKSTVKRPSMVKAKLELISGKKIEVEADGLIARALQHEVDHLNGVLFVDRVSAVSRTRLKKKLKLLAE